MKKKILNPPRCLINVWEKTFIYEHTKFIKTTHLKVEDLNSHFTDNSGDLCSIIGQMEYGDIICRNERTGIHWTWDKWKVSQLKYPEKHIVESKKTKKLKFIENRVEIKKDEFTQLSFLFDEIDNNDVEEVIVDDEEIGSINLDEMEIPEDNSEGETNNDTTE